MNPLPLQDSTHHNKLVQGRRRKAAVGMNLGEERKPDARKAARRWSTAAVGLGPLDVGEDGEREKERESKNGTRQRRRTSTSIERESGTARTDAADEALLREMVWGLSLSLSLSLSLARSLSRSAGGAISQYTTDQPTSTARPRPAAGEWRKSGDRRRNFKKVLLPLSLSLSRSCSLPASLLLLLRPSSSQSQRKLTEVRMKVAQYLVAMKNTSSTSTISRSLR